MLPVQDVSDEVITPEFAFLLILGASEDPESRGLLVHLVKQSLRRTLVLIKEFVGDSSRLDGGTIGEPYLQPGYVDAVTEFLSYAMSCAAQRSFIGIPIRALPASRRSYFQPNSWWNIDSPSLPLNLLTLWARSLAWYIFWFAEYGTDL